MVLSHAHIDHCGNLPNLVKQGFRGAIYCTPATRALATVMLGDSAKIQGEDAKYLNKKRGHGEPNIEPLYTPRDVYQTLLKFQAVPYGRTVEILPGIQLTFQDAGHLLGSATTLLEYAYPDRSRRLVFTGDYGRKGTPLLRDPTPLPAADMIICESTYGGHIHEDVDFTIQEFEHVIQRTHQRGGKLIIPAFSVGRTQTLIYYLHQIIDRGKVPQLPIYVDSPMATRATEVYHSHLDCFDRETQDLLMSQPHLFSEKYVRYVDSVHESIALNRLQNPCIIISASGMCESGRVLHHLKHNIEDPRSTIMIVGYQAPETLGKKLVERRQEVRILGKLYQVKAEVAVLNGLSSHADEQELLSAVTPHRDADPMICLVHAEYDRAAAFEKTLREQGFHHVMIPDRGDVYAMNGGNTQGVATISSE